MLEQGEGGILSPCKVYAARGKDGALRHSPASVGKPEMVPSWFPIKFAEVLTTHTEEGTLSVLCAAVRWGGAL